LSDQVPNTSVVIYNHYFHIHISSASIADRDQYDGTGWLA